MRQRVTYLLSGAEGVDLNPAGIDIGPTALVHSHGHAVEEKRVTLGLAELPEEVGYARLML